MNTFTLLAASGDDVLPAIAAIVCGCGVGATAIIVQGVRRASETRHREQSRREIAAYVAEGSMTADDAYKLLNAGKKPGDAKCDG